MKDMVELFIKHTDNRFDRMEKKTDERFDRVESKVDGLEKFKWKIVGGALVIFFIAECAARLIGN